MSDLNIQLILRLVDRATGPARAALQNVQKASAGLDRSGQAAIGLADRMAEANQRRAAALRGEVAGVVGLGAAVYSLTEPAIQAEARMAEIAKVVDFKGETGFALLGQDIRALVTTGGLAGTADGIMDIVAAAGRMGVVDAALPDAEKRRQLLQFAEDATKMSVAFGISADEAGTTLARWRQNLGLTQDQAMVLGDTVNLLGNSMATTEADILQVINRQGVVAKTAGLAGDEIAALSATLLAAGASPEVAATGLKNFTNALTRGESATKRQQAVWQALGLDAGQVAQTMQTDATGAMLSVLDAFQQIEPYRRTALIGDLFGEEAKGAIAPLIDNTDLLRQTFARAADEAALLGLMEQEYQRQAATTRAERQRFLQYVNALSVTVGTTLLPMLNEMMERVAPVIAQVTAWAEANPELIKQIGWLVAGLLGFKLVALGLRFALLPVWSLLGGGVRAFGLLQRGAGGALRALGGLIGLSGRAGRALGALSRRAPLALSALVTPLKWTARLIPRIPWAVLSGGRFALAGLVAPLKWTARLIPRIPWAVLSGGKFALSALVAPLKWTARLIPRIPWAVLSGGKFALAGLVAPLKWTARLIPRIPWAVLSGGKFALAGLVAPLKWTARLIPRIPWAVLSGGRFALAGLVTPLKWTARLIPRIPWAVLAGGKFALAGLVAPLKWTARLIPRIPWAVLSGGRFALAGLVTPLKWTARLIPRIPWAVLSGGRFALAGLVTPLKWTARLIPRIPWAVLSGGKFALSALVAPLKWTARLLPAVSWGGLVRRSGKFGMNAAGWGRLITPLKWFARSGLRLIPVIGWAAMAAEIGLFAWKHLGLKTLPWDDWIPQIDWSYWFSFSWMKVLPKWNWADIIPEFNILGRLSAIGSPGGGGAATWSPPSTPEGRAATGPALPPRADAPGAFPAPGRALGGPVRAQFAYRINEEGEELFIPSVAGRVIPARAVRALTGAPAIRPVARHAPGAPGGGATRSLSMQIGDIHIHPAPGQSAREIADEVMRRIERARRRADDALHDGGSYA